LPTTTQGQRAKDAHVVGSNADFFVRLTKRRVDRGFVRIECAAGQADLPG
jgi:hypothetical protein